MKRRSGSFTIRGRSLIAGGFAATLCALLLDERDLITIGIIATLLPLVSMAIGSRHTKSLRAKRTLIPAPITAHTDGHLTITLTNSGRIGTRPTQLFQPATPRLLAACSRIVPALKPGQQFVLTTIARPTRRGIYLIPPAYITMTDPFGLWQRHTLLTPEMTALAIPPIVPLTGVPAAGGAHIVPVGNTAQGSHHGDPDITVRPYVPGDDIRTIAWKVSARRNNLLVRNREAVSYGGATVVLDYRLPIMGRSSTPNESSDNDDDGGRIAATETAISAAASICAQLSRADFHFTLCDHNAAQIANSSDGFQTLLAHLTHLTPETAPRIFRPAAIAQPGLVIIISAALTYRDAELLAAHSPDSTRIASLLIPDKDATRTASITALLSASQWAVAHAADLTGIASAWQQLNQSLSYHTSRL